MASGQSLLVWTILSSNTTVTIFKDIFQLFKVCSRTAVKLFEDIFQLFTFFQNGCNAF